MKKFKKGQKVKLYFPVEHRYGDRVFEGDKVHEISEERPGFIERWLKRGCVFEKEMEKELVEPQAPQQPQEPVEPQEPVVEPEGDKESQTGDNGEGQKGNQE